MVMLQHITKSTILFHYSGDLPIEEILKKYSEMAAEKGDEDDGEGTPDESSASESSEEEEEEEESEGNH